MIQKDKIIGTLTWLKQHNYHYSDIQINADWCESTESCDLSIPLDEEHTSAGIVDANITDIAADNGCISTVTSDGGTIGKSNQSTQNNDNNECLVSNTGDEEVNEELEGDEEDKELIEDQAALDQQQELTGDPLPAMVQIDNLENQIYQCPPGKK